MEKISEFAVEFLNRIRNIEYLESYIPPKNIETRLFDVGDVSVELDIEFISGYRYPLIRFLFLRSNHEVIFEILRPAKNNKKNLPKWECRYTNDVAVLEFIEKHGKEVLDLISKIEFDDDFMLSIFL